MSIEWCSYGDGTTIKAYELLKLVWNTIVDVVSGLSVFLSGLGKFVGLCLPSGIVIPMYDNNAPLVKLPEQKFRGLRIGIASIKKAGIPLSFDIPFPKTPIDDVWRAVVAPIDVPIAGSEYYYYNDDGIFRQGIEFTPQRQLKVLGDGVPIAIDVGVILAIAYCLKKMGLGRIASAFITKIMQAKRDAKLSSAFSNTEDIIKKIELLQKEVEEDDASYADILSNVKSLNDKLGVRLLLR